MFDITKFRASAGRTKGTGESRNRAEFQANRFSPARMLFFGPNSAPISGRIPPIEACAVPGVRIRPFRQPVTAKRLISVEAHHFRLCFSRTSIPRRQQFASTDAAYVSQCKARGCMKRATLIAEKVDTAGRHVRQIELCPLHCNVVIERDALSRT